jgi:hypothetical protein
MAIDPPAPAGPPAPSGDGGSRPPGQEGSGVIHLSLEASMSRRSTLPFLLGAGLLIAACDDAPTEVLTEVEPEIVAVTPALGITGNGAPSGAHFNLNIIGVPQDKSADMSQGGGHVIFVPLDGRTRILLSPGDDFLVTDKNGTDGRAEFQLPEQVATTYEVFARALGKPGGTSSMDLCYTDDPGADGVLGTDDDVIVCGGTPVDFEAKNGKGTKKFTNVSKTLFFLSLDVDPESELGVCLGLDTDTEVDEPVVTEEIGLFDGCLEGYLWDYDNNGLKLLQFRFYPKTS